MAQHVGTPLHILIAGAGIGGLTAALALRRQGHTVDVFEQSRLSHETGAAIHLGPNCNGLLRRLGLKVEAIGAVECANVMEYLPQSGNLKYEINVKEIGEKLWAHPWHLVHRAHLHTSLREMAVGQGGKGTPIKLHLASRVKEVDAVNPTIKLEDGTTFHGDLLIGADGVHSITRASIPNGDKQAFDCGKSAFRFLVSAEALEKDSRTAAFNKPSTLIMWLGEDRRIVMYPCMDNKMMNFVCIHPSEDSDQGTHAEGGGWQQTGSKDLMLKIYEGFHPSVRAILEKADDPKVWKLLDMEKMPSFVYGNLALLGDAAHPFLPHQGQGGGQAIEDGVALAALLPSGTLRDDLPERLQLYDHCRYERSHKIQEFTRIAGKDGPRAEGKKTSMMDYQVYNFGHDAWDFASNVLKKHLEVRDSEARYRSPLSFGPSPGPRCPLGVTNANSEVQSARRPEAESYETYSIRFKSSRTYLQNLLPPGFGFASPGTLAWASIKCTTLDGMTWLGGGGYSHCGLYIHGIDYSKRDGSKVHGTFLAVLFENLADPIITGRDELGMPKLFCDIDVCKTSDASGCTITLSWRGAQFGKFEISGLAEKPTVESSEPTKQPESHLASEQGQFLHRYVPAVGLPGKADADYPVFIPNPSTCVAHATKPEKLVSQTASLEFDSLEWHALPTLYPVAQGLADMPIYSVEDVEFVKGSGVSDVGAAQRME